MKKLIPVLLMLTMVACQKEEFNPNQVKSFSIQSTSNGANYSIKVALPDNYDPTTNTYATMYVLDGEVDFDFVANQSKEISNQFSTLNVLVVSIGYGNDRALDYTPSKANEGGGGAEKFMHFIKDELIPKMETDYGADTSREKRIILGHSFGGLFGSYAYTNFNRVFGNYLLLSPSLWYDNEIILKLEQENRDMNMNSKQLVFMGLGGLENSGRMMAPFEAFYQRLNNNYSTMTLSKNIEPQLGHVGSKNPNIQKALRFYFQNQ